MCKIKAGFLISILLAFSLSGCTESNESNDEITHYFLETKNCGSRGEVNITNLSLYECCLLYTSDAAVEGLGVDLGGRRII